VPEPRTVAAFVPDLMDRSRMTAAGIAVDFVDTPDALVTSGAALVVVDLTRIGRLDLLGEIPGVVVGFANHTQRQLMDDAKAAGCDQVLARSAFFSRLADLLGGA